jgi:hypothetical protein
MFSVGVPVCQAQSRILVLGNKKVCHNTFTAAKIWLYGKCDFQAGMIPFDTFTDTHIHSMPTISHGKIYFQKCRFYGNRPCTRSDGNSSAAACLL